ncbi:iron-sulfur cluster-binding protein [Chloroflexi bacterium TSY]|nr:iron-sulfur cluster-binding protein [Chloroflexi bacterium TSY]MBV7334194.1 iron-sulfur cluster-binding protein [Chloroflexi bacterium TSY]
MPKIDLHAPYKQRVQNALDNKHLKVAVDRTTKNLIGARHRAMTEMDGEALRNQVRQMKEYVLRNLPDLLEQFEANVIENGGHVHWVQDAAEANRIVKQLAREHQVELVVKSKSMVTEEIHLNEALEEQGIRAVETDLDEYIIQLDNEPPSHIVAPVIHKRLEDVADVFQRKLDIPPTLDPQAMCAVARGILRKDFLAADMGVSGCNFAIAETGTLCIVTNEGNGRMVSSMPRLYVGLMGIEKLVPTIEDAFLQYQALCRSATGQRVSVYLSMTSGPRQSGDADGPDEFHVILLDNGRTKMLADGYGEALMCIRCGACLNTCPVYREIGGHAYGSTYSGPIGAVISPLLSTHVTDDAKLPHASTLCGACRDVCPVKIDLPRLLVDLRANAVAAGKAPRFEASAIRNFVNAMSSRRRYERSGKLARIATSLASTMSGGNIRFAPPPLSGWTASRNLPPFAPKTFRELWTERLARRRQVSGDTP